ncbi:X-box-binding protein 1 [Teleopsis dalmanni]|uniref:X-box-binding protein 1 n=1 Tax=Teleopsis dalmanni TaxID=139649 RepID=UPI0018CDACBE|nr:X-box-binding protein 1 [Teleopsis dalmanni]
MTATAPAVFITVPKYVAITPSTPSLPKIRPAPTPVVMDAIPVATDEGAPKGKKRRLDHLTWEEKVQRKKLKNRVAAQTSRDRKKARMEEMECEIKELNQKTEILENKCESLQAINDSLLEKNQKLDMEVEMMRQQLLELQQQQQQMSGSKSKVATCTGCESILNGSAVSNTDPLQQGSPLMESQSIQAQLKKTSMLAALWRIVALCLLYKTCSSSKTSSTQESSKSWPKVCSQISQQTWKQAIERAMKLLPKLQAEQSDCLDQWWGPQQSAWNPANIAQHSHKVAA